MTSYPPPPPDPNDAGEPSGVPYPTYSTYQQPGGGMPSYPQGDPGAEAPVEQPQSIVRAVLLMRVGAALSLVGLVLGFATASSLKDNIKRQLVDNGTYTQSKLDTAYNVGLAVGVILGLVGVAVWLWMAAANGKGRKWARIVSTVLGGLNILLVLLSLAQGQQTAVNLVVSVIGAALAMVILVLIWRRESSAFYNARSRPQLS